MNRRAGCLYLVPTPIGNLEDMTFRAIHVLKEVDLIAAEDTRVTKKLCRHFDIATPLISYHEHNKHYQGPKLLEKMLAGKTIALVSDAGTPAISDPGSELVATCIQQGITIVPLPGANAAITALIASGLYEREFYFYGFLPRRKKERERELQRLQSVEVPLIFYEAPHRLTETLQALLHVFGDREATLARELTKRYEEFIRGSLEQLRAQLEERNLRGEFCIVVAGATERKEKVDQWWHELSLIDHVERHIQKHGLTSKEAIKLVAEERGLRRRDVYQAYHVERS